MRRLNIEVDISEKKYFVSKYNDKTLAPELREYIINELVGYNLDSKVRINIVTKFELTGVEEEKYKEIIKKEFRESISELKSETLASDKMKLIMFCLGIMFIISSYFMNSFFGGIPGEILMIFGWVVMWEVAYAIFFTDAKRKRKIKRYKQILNSEIVFKN